MTRFYLYDDAKARGFEPFALTRPVSELRAGAELIRRRWERAAGAKAYGFIGAPHLANFDELDAPHAVSGDTTVAAGSLIANSRFVVSLSTSLDASASAFSSEGSVCAVRLAKSVDIGRLADGSVSLEELVPPNATAAPIDGRWLGEVWDLIGQLGDQLRDDIPVMGQRLSGGAIVNATTIGKYGIYCETGAGIEPFVILDATDGPILIRRGATIAAFTRIVGPTYIGEESHVVGDAVRACSIGDVCKVRGEIASTIMLGHSNKGHTGFVGSSYIGRWVNLGAGSTTSNLKNTYGPVQLHTTAGVRDTGLQFLGSLIGDHAKTGIGTMLTTGCIVGAGANIYGAKISPKRIPPFAWGDTEPYARFEFGKLIEVAERMMARRHVALSDLARKHLETAYRTSGATE